MARLPDRTRAFGGRPANQDRLPVPSGPGNAAGTLRAAVGTLPRGGMNAVAQAILDVGAAHERIQNRDAAVDRAKKITRFKQTATDELRRLQTEEDLSDDEVIGSYKESLDSARADLLNGHGYSADSQASLAAQFEGLHGSAMAEATALSLTAKRAAVDDHLGAAVNEIVSSTYGNPSAENILTQFEAGTRMIDNMAPALTPDEERAWRRAVESNVVEAAVTSFIDRGDIQQAEKVLQQTGVSEILTPEKRQQIFSRIGTARAAIAKRQPTKGPFVVDGKLIAADGQVLYEPAATETDPVTLPRNAILVNPKTGATIAENVSADPAATAKALSEGAILVDSQTGETIASNPADPDKPFGTGVRGGALNVFSTMATRFARGETSPEEDRVFLSAVTDYTQEELNPETGLMRQPKVPAFVSQALRERGMEDILEPAEPDITRRAYQAVGEQTVWEIADSGNLTGPVPVIGRFIGRVPGLGGPAPGMTSAKSYVDVLKRDLIRTLQNNPKFADAERRAIEADVDIGADFFDDKEAYKQRVIGVADALERRLESMTSIANSKTAGREERKWARNGINAIENFLEALLPPRVQTPEEAQEFIKNNPPGTPLLVKDGDKWLDMEVP